jgi:hypothetical protein
MGIDTRYWGPSGWQLFHLIAFRSPHPEELLLMIKDVLPCRFCRESTTQYTHELPMKGDPGKWLYDLHNKVNHKLRTQCKDDPTIVNPGPDPSFEEIKKRYMSMKMTQVPGRDFLFSVAVNYPDDPEPDQMAVQRRFLSLLADVYPFSELRTVFQKYHSQNVPELQNRKAYMKWMYGLLMSLSKKVGINIPSYKGYVQRVMYYKSGCAKKTYKGKTCRRSGGGLTKDRDHEKTRKRVHSGLL